MFYRKLAVVIFSLFLFSCTTTSKVYTDFDRSHNFKEYKTFTWAQNPPVMVAGTYPVSEILKANITSSIKSDLQKKGFKFVGSIDKADFAVLYTIGARDKIKLTKQVETFYVDRGTVGWGGFYYPHLMAQSMERSVPESYTKGSIAVDIFDAKTRQPVWHSTASKKLNSQEIQSSKKSPDEIAATLLASFPPK